MSSGLRTLNLFLLSTCVYIIVVRTSYISYYTANVNFLLNYMSNVLIFVIYVAIGSRIYVLRKEK